MSTCPKVLRRLASCHPMARTPLRPTRTLSNISDQAQRAFHTPPPVCSKSPHPDVSERETVAHSMGPPSRSQNVGQKQFADFDLAGKTYIVTGGARGLGLALAEALVEAGGKVYCVDRGASPGEAWHEAKRRVVPEWGGSLHYTQMDVADEPGLNKLIAHIADRNQGLDGVVAAAGIQQITPAADYTKDDAMHMMAVNYVGVLLTASAAARQMFRYNKRGSIVIVASMSGSVANKGLLSPVYNSSKAAVIQLARNLAMEWSPVKEDGTGGIRVNCISPGHILTPMVLENFEEVPGLRQKWEKENMMGRLAETGEFKGAALFLISSASSFMTGGNLIIDGGHTSW